MLPSQKLLNTLFSYDPESGIITWNTRPTETFATENACKVWNSRFSGKRAGTERTCRRFGYKTRFLKIMGKGVSEHRAIWVIMTGEEPPHEIDHINRDATDNRWKNLRAATHAENHRNRSRNNTNRSGMSGVSWDEEKARWRVVICLNGKKHHFGRHKSLSKAKAIAEKFYRDHGFDPEHGSCTTQLTSYVVITQSGSSPVPNLLAGKASTVLILSASLGTEPASV